MTHSASSNKLALNFEIMRILIYKQTHPGDPDVHGCFGAQDCMGRVRGWKFDAVVGIGGIGREAQSYGYSGNVNWVGIGPHKTNANGMRGPAVTFDHFVDFNSDGPKFRKLAPNLSDRIYSSRMRLLIVDSDIEENLEVNQILALADTAPPSSALDSQTGQNNSKLRATKLCRRKRC
ncbi:MAG: hypothetical protein AB7G28_09365 [Pirellulales bacterium]